MNVSIENFKPLNDQVAVLLPKIEEKTKSGILKTERQILDEGAKFSKFMKVVAVGSNVPETVQVGSYILPARTLTVIPVEVDEEGMQVAVIRVFDIIGVADEV